MESKLKNFFNISDLNESQLDFIISNRNISQCLKEKSVGLLFEKASTRTRISFSVGIAKLKGTTINLTLDELNYSRQESFEDTFKAFSCYLSCLVFRTDDHSKLEKASQYFGKPIINALSDFSHPCQTIGDLYTLKEHFGHLNIKLLWMGDINNVCFSLVESLSFLPNFKIYICSPANLIENSNLSSLHPNLFFTPNINEVPLNDIDCVMTDVFTSMNDDLDNAKVRSLKPYKVSRKLMNSTKKTSVFMHCLPAKLGEEVDQDVINGTKSIVWRQAKNRMFAQMNLFSLLGI